jgi:hypothetical protein
MHPKRKLLIRLGLPLYLLVSLGGSSAMALLDVFVFSADHEPTWLTVFGMIWFLLVSAIMLMLSACIDNIEVQAEKEHYAYLFQTPAPLTEEKVEIDYTQDRVQFSLDKDGLLVRFQDEEMFKGVEQVFDEVPENVVFVPWQDADCFIVTHNENHRVHIGLAVIGENQNEEREDVFVLPMWEKTYAAMHAFGLMQKTEKDWMYLHYNPDDAFKQILRSGRVLKIRDKNTGKVIKDEDEFFRVYKDSL